jgi:hypothetical protein
VIFDVTVFPNKTLVAQLSTPPKEPFFLRKTSAYVIFQKLWIRKTIEAPIAFVCTRPGTKSFKAVFYDGKLDSDKIQHPRYSSVRLHI